MNKFNNSANTDKKGFKFIFFDCFLYGIRYKHSL